MARPTRAAGGSLTAFVLAGPLTALLVLFSLIPTILVLILAFFDYDILSSQFTFAGLANYSRTIDSGELGRATVNTLLYAAMTVPVTLGTGLLVALGINTIGRGATLWRSVYFLPIASSLAAMSIVWQWIFYPGDGPMDATAGRLLGVEDWLGSTTWALPAMAVIGNWQGIGTAMILFLAGLTAIPEGTYEAAWLDGAAAWSRFVHVTLPALGPAAIFALVLTTRNSLAVFDQVKVITEGDPQDATLTLAFAVFRRGIEYLDTGGASVLTVVLLGLLLVVAAVQLRALGGRMEKGGRR